MLNLVPLAIAVNKPNVEAWFSVSSDAGDPITISLFAATHRPSVPTVFNVGGRMTRVFVLQQARIKHHHTA